MTRKRKDYDDEANMYAENVWRMVALPGFSDYQIADIELNGDKGVVRKVSTNQIINQFLSTGYKRVNLVNDDGKRIMKLVHVLMITSEKPSTGSYTIDHIVSTERLNNFSSNLRWATTSEQRLNQRKRTNSLLRSSIQIPEADFRPINTDLIGLPGYSVSRINGVVRTPKKILRIGSLTDGGYRVVNIGKKVYRVHRLVCMVWNDGFAKGLLVNHIDHNKQNNNANNLEWCTASQNAEFAVNHGAIKSKAVAQYTLNGEMIAQYPSITAAGRKVAGDSGGNIRHCAEGVISQSSGFKWKYI